MRGIRSARVNRVVTPVSDQIQDAAHNGCSDQGGEWKVVYIV